MGRIFNQKNQTEKRKILRNSATKAELLLWSKLKGKQIRNLKFRRQYSVNKYVIDFYNTELKLAIEVDGKTHDSEDSIDYDASRQREIENFGIKFIRIRNEQVIDNLEDVISKIEFQIDFLRKD